MYTMYRRLLRKLGFGGKEVDLDGKAADAVLLLGYRFTGVSRNPVTIKAGRDQLVKELSHTFRKLPVIQENQDNVLVGEPALPFTSCNGFVAGNILPLKMILPGQTDVIHKLNSYLPPTVKAFDLIEVSPKFNIAEWDRATCSCYVPTCVLEPSVQSYEGYRLPGKLLSKLEDTAKHVTSMKDLQMFKQDSGFNRNVATVNNISIPTLFEKGGCEYLQLAIDFSGLGTQSVEKIVGTALAVTRSDFDLEELLNIKSTSEIKLPHFPRLILDKVDYDKYNSAVVQSVNYRQIGWLSSRADREMFKQEMFLPDMVADDKNSKMWWNEYLTLPAEVKKKEAVTKTDEIMETDKHDTGQTVDADVMLETEITRSDNVEVIKSDEMREQGSATFTEKNVSMVICKDDTRPNLDGEIRQETDKLMMNDNVDMMNHETDEIGKHGGAISIEMADTMATDRNDTRLNFDAEIMAETEKMMVNDNVDTKNNETDEISKHGSANITDIDDTMVMDKNETKLSFDGESKPETEKMMMNDNVDMINNETDEIGKQGCAVITEVSDTIFIDKYNTRQSFDGDITSVTEKNERSDCVDIMKTGEISKHGGAIITGIDNTIVTDKHDTRHLIAGEITPATGNIVKNDTVEIMKTNEVREDSYPFITEKDDNMVKQTDETIQIRDTIITERNEPSGDVEPLIAEKDDTSHTSESLMAEKDDTSCERDSLMAEKDDLTHKGGTLIAEKNDLTHTHDTLMAEKDNLFHSHDTIDEKGDFTHTHDTLKAEKDDFARKLTGIKLMTEKDDLAQRSKSLKTEKGDMCYTRDSLKEKQDVLSHTNKNHNAKKDDPDHTNKPVKGKKDYLVHTSKTEKAEKVDSDHTSKTVKAKVDHPNQTSETVRAKKDDTDYTIKTVRAKKDDTDHTSKTVKARKHESSKLIRTSKALKDDQDQTSKTVRAKKVDLDYTSKTVMAKMDHSDQTNETVGAKKDNSDHTSKTAKARKDDTDHTSKTVRAKKDDSSKLSKSPKVIEDYPDHRSKTLLAKRAQGNTSKTVKEKEEETDLTSETVKVKKDNTDLTSETVKAIKDNMDLSSDTVKAKKDDIDHISKSVKARKADTDHTGKTVKEKDNVSETDRIFLSEVDHHCLIDAVTVNKTDVVTATDDISFSNLCETNQKKAPNRSEKDNNIQRNDTFETKTDVRSEKIIVGMTKIEKVEQNDETTEVKLPVQIHGHVGSEPSIKSNYLTLVAITDLFNLLSVALDNMNAYLSSANTAFVMGKQLHRKLVEGEKNDITCSFPYNMEKFWELDKILSQTELVNGELQVICEEMEKVFSREFLIEVVLVFQTKKIENRWLGLSKRLHRTQRQLKRSIEMNTELQIVQNQILDSVISQSDTSRIVESTSNNIHVSESWDSGVITENQMDSKQLPDNVILNKTKATGVNYGKNKVAKSSTHRTLVDKTSMKTQLADLLEEERVKDDGRVNSGTENKDKEKKLPKFEDLW